MILGIYLISSNQIDSIKSRSKQGEKSQQNFKNDLRGKFLSKISNFGTEIIQKY